MVHYLFSIYASSPRFRDAFRENRPRARASDRASGRRRVDPSGVIGLLAIKLELDQMMGPERHKRLSELADSLLSPCARRRRCRSSYLSLCLLCCSSFAFKLGRPDDRDAMMRTLFTRETVRIGRFRETTNGRRRIHVVNEGVLLALLRSENRAH